jgi:hypothetical protein
MGLPPRLPKMSSDFRQALEFGDRGARQPCRDRVAVLGACDRERARVEIEIAATNAQDRAHAQAGVIGDGDQGRHLPPGAIHDARDGKQALDLLGAQVTLSAERA